MSATLVVAALAVSGIPLSVLISPLLVAGAAVLVRVADLAVEVPEGLRAWFDRAFHLLPTIWSAIRREDVDLPWDWLAGLFVLPGLIAMVLLWALVRVIFRRTGVGGVLRRMETRPPRPGDLSEQRLANLVQEVAVAAGVPPPRVLLIDTAGANVGAAGLVMEDAAIIITRGFVDRLPRDAQQALIAHVMSSIGNGDLIVAAEILTLLQTWGLISLLLEAPFLHSARTSLALVGRITVQTVQGKAGAASRELALDRMLEGAGYEHDMASKEVEMLPDVHPMVLLFGYVPLLLTVGVAAAVAKGLIWLMMLFTGPFVALLWRTRRRLADATAVQLTRYPEALATALRELAGLEVTVPGAVAVHFLFPIWDPAVDREERTDLASALLRMQLPLEARVRRLQRLGASTGAPEVESRGETAKTNLRELAELFGWLALAVLLLGGLLAASALAAAGVLYLLGWLLHVLLVAAPRWIARLWT